MKLLCCSYETERLPRHTTTLSTSWSQSSCKLCLRVLGCNPMSSTMCLGQFRGHTRTFTPSVPKPTVCLEPDLTLTPTASPSCCKMMSEVLKCVIWSIVSGFRSRPSLMLLSSTWAIRWRYCLIPDQPIAYRIHGQFFVSLLDWNRITEQSSVSSMDMYFPFTIMNVIMSKLIFFSNAGWSNNTWMVQWSCRYSPMGSTGVYLIEWEWTLTRTAFQLHPSSVLNREQ